MSVPVRYSASISELFCVLARTVAELPNDVKTIPLGALGLTPSLLYDQRSGVGKFTGDDDETNLSL